MTFSSKINTNEGEDNVSKVDMYKLGLSQLQNNETPASAEDDWLNNSDTGANITEDDHPWE
jgi:hypothetical protein